MCEYNEVNESYNNKIRNKILPLVNLKQQHQEKNQGIHVHVLLIEHTHTHLVKHTGFKPLSALCRYITCICY